MPPLLRIVLAASCLMLPAAGAWAQVKFKRCLSQSEVKVEQVIRHGIFLRESSARCDEMLPGSSTLWTDFDQRFGPRLKQQTDRRIKLFDREFKADALKVRTYFDGRLVTYHRNRPLTVAYCTNVKDMLTDITKGGWGRFVKQAEVVQNEVYLDYKICQ